MWHNHLFSQRNKATKRAAVRINLLQSLESYLSIKMFEFLFKINF